VRTFIFELDSEFLSQSLMVHRWMGYSGRLGNLPRAFLSFLQNKGKAKLNALFPWKYSMDCGWNSALQISEIPYDDGLFPLPTSYG
jgi:hypothetical protein